MSDSDIDPALGGDIEVVQAVQLALMRARGPEKRGQHFKMNGCVDARFEVHPQLPAALRVGLFGTPASYRAVVRFSNGAESDDRKPDIHGMAIKLFDVPGRKLLDEASGADEPGADESGEQDIILADHPVFFVRTASDYALFMQDVARSAPQGKQPEAFIAHLREHYPQDLPVLMAFVRKHLQHSPLASTYWSQVPYAFGAGDALICRYRAVPAAAPAVPRAGADDIGSSPDYLRERMIDRLAEGRDELVFNFDVQLKHGADRDDIDNPTVEWDEPYVTVASVRIPPQHFDTAERDRYGEQLGFTPWHALEVHRPLGEANEVRRQVYLASQKLRDDSRAASDDQASGGC